jgi:hypothetical protein
VSADSSILLFGAEPNSFLTRRFVLDSGHESQGAQLFVGVCAASRLHITLVGNADAVRGRARASVIGPSARRPVRRR